MTHNADALAVIRFFFFNTCQWRVFLRQQISDCGSDVTKNHNCSQSYEKGFWGEEKGETTGNCEQSCGTEQSPASAKVLNRTQQGLFVPGLPAEKRSSLFSG